MNALAIAVRISGTPSLAQRAPIDPASKRERHVRSARLMLGMLLSLGVGACVEHKTDTLDAAAPSGKTKCPGTGAIGNCTCGAGRNGTMTCGQDGEWTPCICVTPPDAGMHKLDAGS